MSAEKINRMTEEFTQSNGLVNYLHFFRNYLNDLTGNNGNDSISTPIKSKSMTSLNGKSGSGGGGSGLLKPLHPWDFEYSREKNASHPYWYSAAKPKDPNSMKHLSLVTTGPIPSPNEKSASELHPNEKEILLAQYSSQTLSMCKMIYKHIAPVWRELRSDLKKNQINTQRGCVLTPMFVSLLEKHGILLNKNDMSTVIRVFRGVGMQDMVKYDEFLRVCLVVKDYQPQG